MSRRQLIIQTHAAYLRQLEQHLAVSAGSRRREIQAKLRSAQSKLEIILRQS